MTATEYNKRNKEKMLSAGFKRVQVWIRPEHEPQVRQYQVTGKDADQILEADKKMNNQQKPWTPTDAS